MDEQFVLCTTKALYTIYTVHSKACEISVSVCAGIGSDRLVIKQNAEGGAYGIGGLRPPDN